MRVRDNFKEEPKEKLTLGERVLATTIGVALVAAPVIVYKVEETKIEMMQSTYEVILEESNKRAYMEGFVDGLFVKNGNNLINNQEGNLQETNLINEYPEIDIEKRLVFINK